MVSIHFPNFFGNVNDFIQDFLDNFETQWGILNREGEPFTGLGLSLVGATQSTAELNYNKTTVISDFPIEDGGFASYNKIELPSVPMVMLRLTGNKSDGAQFLNAIDSACKSTELFSVITPEIQYIGYSIERYDYIRTAFRNATMLEVRLFLKEIRQVSITTSNSKGKIKNPTNSSSTPSQNGGRVQGSGANQQTQNSFINGLN